MNGVASGSTNIRLHPTGIASNGIGGAVCPKSPCQPRGHTARIRMGVDYAAKDRTGIDVGKAAGEASAERHVQIALNVHIISNGWDVIDSAATIRTVDIERGEPDATMSEVRVQSPLICKLIWASSPRGSYVYER